MDNEREPQQYISQYRLHNTDTCVHAMNTDTTTVTAQKNVCAKTRVYCLLGFLENNSLVEATLT